MGAVAGLMALATFAAGAVTAAQVWGGQAGGRLRRALP